MTKPTTFSITFVALGLSLLGLLLAPSSLSQGERAVSIQPEDAVSQALPQNCRAAIAIALQQRGQVYDPKTFEVIWAAATNANAASRSQRGVEAALVGVEFDPKARSETAAAAIAAINQSKKNPLCISTLPQSASAPPIAQLRGW